MARNGQHRLHGLDNLRTFAIVFVFLFHYPILSGGQPEWLPNMTKFGWTGVDLFFVLSGFLISSQLFSQMHQGHKISFSQFFLKRAFRILPAFLVTVALYFCIPFFREKESLPPLWQFLTFTQNFNLNLKESGTFSHAWSLCVEEHFYLFLPIILSLLRSGKFLKKSYWLLIILFLAGFAIRTYSYNHFYLSRSHPDHAFVYWYKYLYYPTYTRLDGLLAGVSIAAIYQFLPTTWRKLSRYGNAFLVAGLAVLTGGYFLCYDQSSFSASVFGFPVIAVGYGLLVLATINPSSMLYKWNPKTMRFIATLSYAIYLTHKGIIHLTQTLLNNLEINSSLMLIICMATCTGFAFLLHLAVERPFMKWRSRIVKPESPAKLQHVEDEKQPAELPVR